MAYCDGVSSNRGDEVTCGTYVDEYGTKGWEGLKSKTAAGPLEATVKVPLTFWPGAAVSERLEGVADNAPDGGAAIVSVTGMGYEPSVEAVRVTLP